VAEEVTISARNVVKAFGQGPAKVRAMEDVSVDVRRGKFFTLRGPSGRGKTTLLRQIAGFEMPKDGTILLEGADTTGLPPNRRPVNKVFQSCALFPHLTVAQNVAFALEMLGKPAAEVKAQQVQCDEICRRFRGSSQKVAIFRARLKPGLETRLPEGRLHPLDGPGDALEGRRER
jgi:spermidine/putrescine transport system ATP-binding protein